MVLQKQINHLQFKHHVINYNSKHSSFLVNLLQLKTQNQATQMVTVLSSILVLYESIKFIF